MYLIAKVKAVPMLYFQKPKQLLSIFTDLEDENLKLIQECREAEGNLEKIRTSVREVSWMEFDSKSLLLGLFETLFRPFLTTVIGKGLQK